MPSQLLGSWSFTRSIAEHRTGARYRAHGTARFSPATGGRVRWFEEGVLTTDGESSPFTRTLFLVPGSQGWTVTFEDGRFFHPWVDGQVTHLCGRDTYRGDIAGPQSSGTGVDQDREPASCDAGWQITWTVSGPHKDYTMTTGYRPITE
ncbi:hypothetical protein C0Z11_05260 [Acidipropionibacterium jensenii]|uniref:DUF6314 family protein n=1 Tax=Acidipropionibacterium jensenii TaxID=1749 RepID=UPI000BC33013|nr:DUF6314 family protein [Acidipropionibacterium jensenii]AZZ41785.1 hypothetical protein C0Z11_05260 [Acidipropionibacterium jensenii]